MKKLKSGEIDIIIGTHRIIQKDIKFRDLGLLIIDEEQRFGVGDKERLKELKKDIDVLSMTATPIPRTLHMAMISVRDMSLLEEPPENRYPVQTYVMEHDDGVINDAIRREIARGGQVFYLYNRVKGIYHELTLYMDIWNNEIVTHALSTKRGDRMTYISGLNDLIELKKQYPEYEMVLHSDQGSVYASKKYNELLPMYHIKRSMSRAGTPTDNGAMEAINGWIKAELFTDFHIKGDKPIAEEIDEYIKFFNEERPAYALNYLTPRQYKEIYSTV